MPPCTKAGRLRSSQRSRRKRVECLPMSDEICRRFIVSGRVQGVFFRASTASVAARLGLRGRARNMADGKVSVLALGPESKVAELKAWLHDGPPSARVTEIEVLSEPPEQWQHLPDFRTA